MRQQNTIHIFIYLLIYLFTYLSTRSFINGYNGERNSFIDTKT